MATKNRYDAIVLDGNLPRMDGLEVVRRLRDEAKLSIPIIMVSARDMLEEKIKSFELGVDDCLTKPLAAQELAARLRAVIRRDRKELLGGVLKVGELTLDPHSIPCDASWKKFGSHAAVIQVASNPCARVAKSRIPP